MNRLVLLAVIVALAFCGVAAFEKDTFEVEGGAPRRFPEFELDRFKTKSEESSEESSEGKHHSHFCYIFFFVLLPSTLFCCLSSPHTWTPL